MRTLLFSLSSLLVLASGCGDDTSPPAGGGGGSSEYFVEGSVRGDVELALEAHGALFCHKDPFGDPPFAEIEGLRSENLEVLQNVRITLPYDLPGVGSYALVGIGDQDSLLDRFDIYLELDGHSRFEHGSGQIVITAWPEEDRGAVRGSFTASLTNANGETVEIEAEIDGIASPKACIH